MKDAPSEVISEEGSGKPDLSAGLAVAVSAALTIYLGLMPGSVLDWAREAITALL